jgi:hypothetical protein
MAHPLVREHRLADSMVQRMLAGESRPQTTSVEVGR